jgi:hypothetical protein
MEENMQFISRAKTLAGLGIAAAGLAVAVPVAALAAPAAPHAAVASVGEDTLGCAYQVGHNINLYRTPGGARSHVLPDSEIVFSAPRTVVNGPSHTRWAYVIVRDFKATGFVNKAFLRDIGCITPRNS